MSDSSTTERQIMHFLSRFFWATWLRIALCVDILRGKVKWDEFQNPILYLDRRHLCAASKIVQFINSPELAQFALEQRRTKNQFRARLLTHGDKRYFLDLVNRDVMLSCMQYTVPSSAGEALDALRQEHPERDPYLYAVYMLWCARYMLRIKEPSLTSTA